MRKFAEITKDIEAARESLNASKEAETGRAFVKGKGPAPAVRALIYSIFCSCLILLAFAARVYEETTGDSKSVVDVAFIVFIVAAGIFLILFAIAFIKYTAEHRSTAAAIGIAVISGLMFLSGAVLLIKTLNPGEFVKLFSGFENKAIEFFDVADLSHLSKPFMYSAVAICAASLLLIITSVIKLVKVIKLKKLFDSETERLANAAKANEANLSSLENELSQTENEAKETFEREIAKESPDCAVIQSISDLGFEPAAEWLVARDTAALKEKAKSIYETEIAKEEPDTAEMVLASAFGSSDASLWLAKNKVNNCISNFNEYAKSELTGIFQAVKDVLERAGECKDQRAVKVLSVLSQVVCAAYSDGKLTGPSDEEISDGMKMLREWKKDSAPESDDCIFTEKLINVFITAADDLKESNRRKAEVNEQKRAAEQAAREAASATANMYKPQQTINLKCKYDANGICTYRSTSSYLAKCTRSGSDQLICSDYKRG